MKEEDWIKYLIGFCLALALWGIKEIYSHSKEGKKKTEDEIMNCRIALLFFMQIWREAVQIRHFSLKEYKESSNPFSFRPQISSPPVEFSCSKLSFLLADKDNLNKMLLSSHAESYYFQLKNLLQKYEEERAKIEPRLIKGSSIGEDRVEVKVNESDYTQINALVKTILEITEHTIKHSNNAHKAIHDLLKNTYKVDGIKSEVEEWMLLYDYEKTIANNHP